MSLKTKLINFATHWPCFLPSFGLLVSYISTCNYSPVGGFKIQTLFLIIIMNFLRYYRAFKIVSEKTPKGLEPV